MTGLGLPFAIGQVLGEACVVWIYLVGSMMSSGLGRVQRRVRDRLPRHPVPSAIDRCLAGTVSMYGGRRDTFLS